MSWSVSIGGKKEEAREKIAAQFDSEAKRYEGGEEGKDVLAMKERVLALIDAIDCTPDDMTPRPGISVSCWGSHSTVNGKISSAQASISVSRVALPEEAPPAAG